jgi:hypothetical protein
MLLMKEKWKVYFKILNYVFSWKQIVCILCIIYDLDLIDVFSKFKLSKS